MWFRRGSSPLPQVSRPDSRGSRDSIIFDFEMRLWAVLRAGRVVQSQSSYSKPVGGFLGGCDLSPLQLCRADQVRQYHCIPNCLSRLFQRLAAHRYFAMRKKKLC
jgi:hypothetical protein